MNEDFGFRRTNSTDSGEDDYQLVVDGTLVVALKYTFLFSPSYNFLATFEYSRSECYSG